MDNEFRWVTAHAAAQYEAAKPLVPHAAGKTMRCEIRSPFSARRVRVFLCERYGEEPTLCGRAMLGVGESVYPLAFAGQEEVLLPPGLELASDPVEVDIKPGDTLSLWLYYAGKHAPRSLTILPAQYSKEGDHCGLELPPQRRFSERLEALKGARCYARLEAETDDLTACSVAAFGDSITSMGLWTDPLEKKLRERGGPALLNLGIGGNRLLTDTSIPLLKGTQLFGRAALTRFSWDVIPLNGACVVMVALGVNDISQPNVVRRCTARELISGFEQLLSRCAERGLKTVGCTITPFGGYLTYNEATERLRAETNDWIINGGAFDETVDFASAVRDPQRPGFMLPAYDSGDHLHPSRSGGEKMAEAVDLDALLRLAREG